MNCHQYSCNIQALEKELNKSIITAALQTGIEISAHCNVKLNTVSVLIICQYIYIIVSWYEGYNI